MIDAKSPGSIFFLPHGTKIFNKLVQFMKLQQTEKHHFQEVVTPLIFKKKLWEISGHWDNYQEDMFQVEGFNDPHEEYGLKPMNCPGHCLIFDRFDRSHQELPVRFSDWSSLHRNEASGALSGLSRVRRFHQDDGHIFCNIDQIAAEIQKTLKLISLVYKTFGLNEYQMMLSTRPGSFIGTVKEWDHAESQLRRVLDETSTDWIIREGDGAFYGPKIDVLLTDRFKKQHQVATVQLDFQLPQRFELKYRDPSGVEKQPILIHRAIFGSLERFMALLIDHYDGKWPFWLSPRQAVVIPVNDTHKQYAESVAQKLRNEQLELDSPSQLHGYKFEVDVNCKSETVGKRIKEALRKDYNYIIMVGDKELQSKTVALRSRSDRTIKTMTPQQVFDMFIVLQNEYK